MGWGDKNKNEVEPEKTQEESEKQTAAQAAAIRVAIRPLERQIDKLEKIVNEMSLQKQKIEIEYQYNLDDRTKKEISNLTAGVTAGLESYKVALKVIFVLVLILGCFTAYNAHKLKETAENMDARYDVVTGILSGDRHYWWNGENYEASRKAPEAKRLQEAVDNYQKISEQMKKTKN